MAGAHPLLPQAHPEGKHAFCDMIVQRDMDATIRATQHDTEWSADDLFDRLERGDELFVVDIRDDDDFKRFKIEGLKEVPALNVPIYEMLDQRQLDLPVLLPHGAMLPGRRCRCHPQNRHFKDQSTA